MSEELKPCPFCKNSSDFLIERVDLSSSVVICQGMIDEYSACLARGPVGVQDDDGEEQPGKAAAIREWNTRALPEGYVLVPVEPTSAMLYAAEKTKLPEFCTSSRQSRHHEIAGEVYKAMLAAAQEGEN